jgi:ABC-2 type transport system ATP-binding protein
VSLEIDRLTKRYGSTLALDAIQFSVPKGQIFGFLGANGAGKTTTMRICLGIIPADAGEVRWDSTPVLQLSRALWGYLPEERGLYPRLPVLDQLVYLASLYGTDPGQARRDATQWLERFRIPELASRRAEELSKGNQQKVQFIAAILHDPEILLLDEPFTGLDDASAAALVGRLRRLRERGALIVLATHDLDLAEGLLDRAVFLRDGRMAETVEKPEGLRSVYRRVMSAPFAERRAGLSGPPGGAA